MLNYLLSLFLIIFALGNLSILDVVKKSLVDSLNESSPLIETSIPVITDPQVYIEENAWISNQDSSDNDKLNNSDDPLTQSQNSNDSLDSDTNKSEAYNNNSEKPIEEVTNVAIDNSPALDNCVDTGDHCEEESVENEPTPILTPTPVIEPICYTPPQVNPIYYPPPPCTFIGNHPEEGQ